MSQQSTATLATLLEYAQQARDQARAKVARAQARLASAQGQVEQLRDYRNHTQQRWGDQLRQGAQMSMVQVYHGFLGRLHDAVDLQGHQVQRLEGELHQIESEVQAAEMKVAALEKLIARRAAEARHQAERREQKQLDEHVSRMAWQQSHGGDSSRGYSAAGAGDWQ
jgi:flagellar FliJ protein